VKTLIYMIITAALASSLAWADADPVLFSVLLIEPGARQGGFGKAFTGVADDATAVYYNAGGLALQEKNSVNVMHEPRGSGDLKDMFYDYVSLTYRFGKFGTLGAALTYNDAGSTDALDEQGRSLGYKMRSYLVAPTVLWSYPIFPSLGVGAGITYVYEHLTDENVLQKPLANAGIFYRSPIKGLNGGVSFNYLGTNDTSTTSGDNDTQVENSYPPPRNVRLGVSYKVLSTDLNDLLATADGSKLLMNFDDSLADELGQGVYSGGAEYTYAKMVSVRTGYYWEKAGRIKGLTLGFGFAYHGFSFDYARVPEGEAFGDRHRFAVGYAF